MLAFGTGPVAVFPGSREPGQAGARAGAGVMLPCSGSVRVAVGCSVPQQLPGTGQGTGRQAGGTSCHCQLERSHSTEPFTAEAVPFSFHVTWGFFSSFPAMLSQCCRPSFSAGRARGPGARAPLLVSVRDFMVCLLTELGINMIILHRIWWHV